MDEEDDTFLKQLNATLNPNAITENHFESIMWELESITNQQLPHLNLDPTQLPDFDAFQSLIPSQSTLLSQTAIDAIFEHWRQRRSKRGGKSVIPVLQYEDLVKNEVDPYVCFRRRETKSVRKTRRTDQHSLERLRRLRNEMEMARNLLEMVLKREKIRKEGLVLDHSVFDKKCKFREYQRILGIKEDEELFAPTTKKKRKISSSDSGTGTTIKIPLNKLKRDGYESRLEKSPMQLAIESELQRKKEQDAPYEDITECPFQPFPKSTPQLFYSHLFMADPVTSKRILYRKRHGRNGRLFLDRTEHCHGYFDSPGGKSKPLSQAQLDARQRYRFDSDYSSGDDDEDDNCTRIDLMDNRSLRHRSQLLSETDLRNLTTIPLTPLNMMNRQKANMHSSVSQQPQSSSSPSSSSSPVATTSTQQNTSAILEPTSASPLNGVTPMTNGTSSALSPTPIKRQNSNRNKMTPQQAALAMANGMIVANMTAAVNQNGQGKSAAMQMAMAAAQQQQQQQQQQQISSSTKMNPSPIGSVSHQ
ncbi:unnamed protein product [Absidia cylindrospora]